MSKRYKIDTVADITKIPEDRLDDFFIELRQFVEISRNIKSLLDATAKAVGEDAPDNAPITMYWQDDGKRNKKIKISVLRKGDDGKSKRM